MRFAKFVTTVGLVAAFSSSALAGQIEAPPGEGSIADQCLKDLRAFDDKLARVGFGILPPDGFNPSTAAPSYDWGVEGAGTPRQKIHALRDAAYVYALEDDERSCQMVLASMRRAFEQHQTLVGRDVSGTNVRRRWRRAHLERAKPVTQMNHLMRVDLLIGSEIRNTKDEKLGEIEDVVLDPKNQNALYVLASRGGFFGFGKKLVAVRWNDLRATEDHELYVLNASIQAFEAAPEVDRSKLEKSADAAWRRALAAYWDAILNP